MTLAPTHREAKASASDAVSKTPEPGDPLYRSVWETKHVISHQEAREVARRLIASHFRRTDCETARASIPANPERDDDILIISYIRQQARKDAALALAAVPASVGAEEEAALAVKALGVEPGETAFRAYYEHGGATWENLSLLGRRQWTRVEVALARRARPAVSASASAGAVPAGWRLVPEEATEEMWVAVGTLTPTAFCEAWKRALSAAPATPEPAAGGREIVRHLKRGTEYEVLHQGAELQVSRAELLGPDRFLFEGARLVIYRGTDGKVWAREESEFRDGRFETVTESRSTLSASTADGETAGDGWSYDMEAAPKDRPILAWLDHEADPSPLEGAKLTLYASHAEGMGHAPTGYAVVEWGGGFDDRTYEYPNEGHLPDWWFVAGTDFEVAANPVAWMLIDPPTPTRPDATAEDAAPATPAEGR